MKATLPCLLALVVATAGCAHNGAKSKSQASTMSTTPHGTAQTDQSRLKTVADYTDAAARRHYTLRLPDWETTPAQVKATTTAVIAEGDRQFDKIAAQDLGSVTFDSTIAAIDDAIYPVVNTMNRMDVIKESSADAQVREAAADQVTRLSQWLVGTAYREGVYKACKAYEDLYTQGRRPRLHGEDLKLLTDTMRDYRRAGMALDPQTRQRVEAMRKDLAEKETRFGANISNAKVSVTFAEADLAGVPKIFMDQFRQPNGDYVVDATVTPQVLTVLQTCTVEETRKKVDYARCTMAQQENTALLDEMVRLRGEIATTLGYRSWDDYQTETRMAKTGDRAASFVKDMIKGLEPKYKAEMEQLRQLKVAATGDPNAQINAWDWRYYQNQLLKQKYSIDTEALRVYFPLDRTLQGMFNVYQNIFGLKFEQIQAPYKWAPDVTLYMVTDAASGDPLGMFYLDLFPREGKYTHFAQFGIIDGKVMQNGAYQRPVVALLCNFTPPTKDAPSLLTHDEVETLFHEFGHALHSILTQAHYAQFAGTNVPRDFVEAPSQMLENWVWDVNVLNTFAADYRDPSKKIDPAVLAQMNAAKLATAGVGFRRQMAFALGDLRVHGPSDSKDTEAIFNQTMAEVFLPNQAGTNFSAAFGHMAGYDAGYYGYGWAKAISEDMATKFRQSKDGFMSKEVGMELRADIYEVGGSREINESIYAFLGRDWSIEPFLKSIGVK